MMTKTPSESFKRVAKPAIMMIKEDTTTALQAATTRARNTVDPVMEIGKSSQQDDQVEVVQFSGGDMNLNENHFDQAMNMKLSRSAVTALAFGALTLGKAAPAMAKAG